MGLSQNSSSKAYLVLMFAYLGHFWVVDFRLLFPFFFISSYGFNENKWELTVFIQMTEIRIFFIDQCRIHYRFAILGLGSLPSQIIKELAQSLLEHTTKSEKSRNIDGDANSPSIFFLSCLGLGMLLPALLKRCSVHGTGLFFQDFIHTLPSHTCLRPGPSHSLLRTDVSCKWTTDPSSLIKHSYFGM